MGRVSSSKVEEMAFWTAGAPASVSTFTEVRYKTLHTARRAQSAAQPQPAALGPRPAPGIVLLNRAHVPGSDLL